MNEQQFYQALAQTARKTNINPLLLLSGIEGLYTFKNVPLNTINYEFLDSLILSIFALRIGDQFHTLAEENLLHEDAGVRQAAALELKEISAEEIEHSSNAYLKSFAAILNGKSTIRQYHAKSLEVAALEINNTRALYAGNTISTIVLDICQTHLSQQVDLAAIFGN